ncbi:MAG: TIGR04282 family arsenosugar biosynthesis glycosyltransferase [Caulobacterales bacterium]|jgi:rSAM/selenodomain-associated transferase 1
MAERPILIVMAKAPRQGLGKTRLAQGVGVVAAWRINRAMQAKALRVARRANASVVLAVPRKDMRTTLPGVWPRDVARQAQGEGDLGARLARLFCAIGPRPCAVIGADCPDADDRALALALRRLRRDPVVIGPTTDGGFWFFGAQRASQVAPAFAQTAWSTPTACADLQRAARGCVRLPFTLSDIDTIADWRAYRAAKRARGSWGR